MRQSTLLKYRYLILAGTILAGAVLVGIFGAVLDGALLGAIAGGVLGAFVGVVIETEARDDFIENPSIVIFSGITMGGVFGAIAGAGLGAINDVVWSIIVGTIIGSPVGLLVGLSVLKFLRKGVRADLVVSIENRRRQPGDNVHVDVTLSPHESFYLREGKVELACMETAYSYREESDKLDRVSRPGWSLAEPFLQEGQISDGQSYRETFSFSLPEEAPSSMTGEATEISWRVRASLDIPGAKDISRERVLTVFPGKLEAPADPPAPAVEEKLFDQCVLSMSLTSAMARAGETVDGTLSLRARRDMRVRSIRIELECWEKAGEKEVGTVKKMVRLRDPSSNQLVVMAADQRFEWPVRLQIPKDALPSVAANHTQVVWRVKGMLSGVRRAGSIPRRKRDLEIQQEIQVYVDPPEVHRPTG